MPEKQTDLSQTQEDLDETPFEQANIMVIWKALDPLDDRARALGETPGAEELSLKIRRLREPGPLSKGTAASIIESLQTLALSLVGDTAGSQDMHRLASDIVVETSRLKNTLNF